MNLERMTKKLWVITGGTLGIAAVATAASLSFAGLVDFTPKTADEQLYDSCMREMGSKSCVMTDEEAQRAPASELYKQLRASGPLMCTTILEACRSNRSSEACKLGKSLFL